MTSPLNLPVLALKWFVGNGPAHLNPTQNTLLPYVHGIIMFWIIVWIATAIILLVKLAREYIQHSRQTRAVDPKSTAE